jgi:hypothetical protein
VHYSLLAWRYKIHPPYLGQQAAIVKLAGEDATFCAFSFLKQNLLAWFVLFCEFIITNANNRKLC